MYILHIFHYLARICASCAGFVFRSLSTKFEAFVPPQNNCFDRLLLQNTCWIMDNVSIAKFISPRHNLITYRFSNKYCIFKFRRSLYTGIHLKNDTNYTKACRNWRRMCIKADFPLHQTFLEPVRCDALLCQKNKSHYFLCKPCIMHTG